MARWSNFYLIHIEFLGFRYHGWQVQSGLKSVEGMINKTLPFVFKHQNFKVLGCGRTDAKVSADDYAFELFCNEQLNLDEFLATFNSNLPLDIRAKSIIPVDANFNIIQHPKTKEYHYHFSYGAKTHPFNAPFVVNFEQQLDIAKMQQTAQLFEGTHNFKRYATKPSANTIFERNILLASIAKNKKFTNNFHPTNTYVFKVKAKGFLRYQVRLMMGALIDVGSNKISIEELKESLTNFNEDKMKTIVPSSGLILHKVSFD